MAALYSNGEKRRKDKWVCDKLIHLIGQSLGAPGLSIVHPEDKKANAKNKLFKKPGIKDSPCVFVWVCVCVCVRVYHTHTDVTVHLFECCCKNIQQEAVVFWGIHHDQYLKKAYLYAVKIEGRREAFFFFSKWANIW